MNTNNINFAQVTKIIREQKDSDIIISERSGNKFNIEVISDSNKSITNQKLIDILFRNSYVGDSLEELNKLLTSVTGFPEELLEEDNTIVLIKPIYGKRFQVGVISL